MGDSLGLTNGLISEPSSLERLIEKHYSTMLNWAETIVGANSSITTPQDLVQQAALNMLKNKEKFDPATNFMAWAYIVMRNQFINDCRQYKRKGYSDIDISSPIFDTISYSIRGGDPESTLATKYIRSLLYTMDDRLKKPLMMYMDGYKYKEIARTLNVPLGTIKSQIRKARLQIIQSLEDDL